MEVTDLKLTNQDLRRVKDYILLNANNYHDNIDQLLEKQIYFYGVNYTYNDVKKVIDEMSYYLINDALTNTVGVNIDSLSDECLNELLIYTENSIDYDEAEFDKLLLELEELDKR